MKRYFILAAGAVLVAAAVSAFVYIKNGKEDQASFFKANVEALAADETVVSGISGHCDDTPTLCFYVCSCGRKWDAMRNTGPAWGVSGVCVCGQKVN